MNFVSPAQKREYDRLLSTFLNAAQGCEAGVIAVACIELLAQVVAASKEPDTPAYIAAALTKLAKAILETMPKQNKVN